MSCFIMHFEGQSLTWQGQSSSKNSHAILRQALLCPDKDKDDIFTLEEKRTVRGGDPFLGAANGDQSMLNDRSGRKKPLGDGSVFDITSNGGVHGSKFKPTSPTEKILFDSAADLIQDDIHTEMEVAAHLPADTSEYTANLLSQLSSSSLLPTMTSSQVSSVLSALEPNIHSTQMQSGITSITNPQTKCHSNNNTTEQQIQTDFIKTTNNSNLTIVQEQSSVLPTDIVKQEKTKKKRTFCLATKAIVRYYTENRIKGNIWYQCSACPFISIFRNTIIQHCIISHDGNTVNNKPGSLPNLQMYKCIACNNLFYNTHSLKVHYIYDHSATNEEIDDLLKLTIEINKYLKTSSPAVTSNLTNNIKLADTSGNSVKDLQLQENCVNTLQQVHDEHTSGGEVLTQTNTTSLFPLFFEEPPSQASNTTTPPIPPIVTSTPPSPPLPSPPSVVAVVPPTASHCQVSKSNELSTLQQPTVTSLTLSPPSSTSNLPIDDLSAQTIDTQILNTSINEQQSNISPKIKDPALKKFKDLKLKKGGGKKCGLGGCALRFGALSNLEYHKKCHHRTKWRCPECHKSCTSWNTVSSHLWREHGIDIELYSCDHCSYKTNSLTRLLNLHRRIHSEERPFLCDVCGKGFKTTKQLRNHKSWHKLKEKNKSEISEKVVSCLTCGRGFNCARLMRLHVQVVHKRLKPYLCYVCGHSAANKSSLRLHQSMHTGLRPYSCNECDYTTRDHNNLRRHKMRHSGIKRYKCPLCTYSSIQASTYKTHILKKHPGQQDGLLYRCEMCSFNTVKKENLLTHSARHEISKNITDPNVT